MRSCLRYDAPELHDEFRELCYRAHLTREQCAGFLGISLRTLHRWRSDNDAPVWARRLLILRQGDLGSLWPEWTGWRFDGPELWTPEDKNYTGGEIRAILYREALIAAYRAQLRKAVRQGSGLRPIKEKRIWLLLGRFPCSAALPVFGLDFFRTGLIEIRPRRERSGTAALP